MKKKSKRTRRQKCYTILRCSMIISIMLICMWGAAFKYEVKRSDNQEIIKEVQAAPKPETNNMLVDKMELTTESTALETVDNMSTESSELYKLNQYMEDKKDILEFDVETTEVVANFKEEKNKNPLENTENKEKAHRYRIGYTSSRVNLRASNSTDSDVICVIGWNEKISYKPISSEWAYVQYKNKYGCVSMKYISDNEIDSTTYGVPFYEHQKSYMDYRKITDESSKAYKLQITDAYTGKYGIRQVDGRFLCALGTYYVEDDDIGRYVDLVLRNGTVIPCIIGDNKDNSDTDGSNQYTCHDNSIVEFVVDTPCLRYKVRRDGNLNRATSRWESSIEKIVVYDYKYKF